MIKFTLLIIDLVNVVYIISIIHFFISFFFIHLLSIYLSGTSIFCNTLYTEYNSADHEDCRRFDKLMSHYLDSINNPMAFKCGTTLVDVFTQKDCESLGVLSERVLVTPASSAPVQ